MSGIPTWRGSWRVAILLAVLPFAGACLEADHPARRAGAGECGSDERYYRGFCLPSVGSAADGIEGRPPRIPPGKVVPMSDPLCEPGASQTCYTGDPGDLERDAACAAGQRFCVNEGWTQCMGEVGPEPERCNGIDDDCDGLVDEALTRACYPAGTDGCSAGPDFDCVGQCAAGESRCVDGAFGACEGAVTPAASEQCTTSGQPLDEDCDGAVDEGCPCVYDPDNIEPRDCYTGPDGTRGVGACRAGTQVCAPDATWGPCEGQNRPSRETCQNMGSDDDCDGVLDDVPRLGEYCLDTSERGVCREGIYECGAEDPDPVCVTPSPGELDEACNNRDDDCDGDRDEDFDFRGVEHCGGCNRSCASGQACCEEGGCADLSTNPAHCGACGRACAEGEVCCNGTCRDTQSDEAHCGSCGNACDVEAGETCCGGTCTRTTLDPQHCGECGSACAEGQNCCDGSCESLDCACVACEEGGGDCCGTSCTNTATDEQNCGSCGDACDEGETCMSGLCCGSDEQVCDGRCVSLDDPQYCGGCSTQCGEHEACCDGTCIDTRTSDDHCGGCGGACGGEAHCSGGACCPAETEACDGACVDLSTSVDHCGSCGDPCADGEVCCGGQCVQPGEPQEGCGCPDCEAPRTCCGASCVDLQTDEAHCGACGFACESGDSCCRGRCLPTANGCGP